MNRPGDVTEIAYLKPGAVAVGNAGYGYAAQSAVTDSDIGRWLRIKSVVVKYAGAQPSFTKVFASVLALPAGTGFVGGSLVGGNFNVASNASRALLPAVGAPEFNTSVVPYSSTKLTACAALFTNVTQILNKAGTVLAGRLSPAINDAFNVTTTALNGLHPAEKAWLPLETGLYTYCPPSSDLATFYNYAQQVQNQVGTAFVTPFYRLDNTAMTNVAFITAPSGVACELACTVSTHLEFRTSSALFQLGVSGFTLETLHVAQLSLMSAGFFFENPEHKSLLTRISNGIKKLEPYVTPVVAAAQIVHPPTGKVLAAAYNAAKVFTEVAGQSKKKQQTAPRKVVVAASRGKMVTTTAKRSGILGPANRGRKRK